MSRFMILIYGDEKRWREMSQEERAEIDAAHGEFWAKAEGSIIASGELQGPGTAVTVRRGTDGEPTTVDGPFTEAKEVVGGFALIRAGSKEEAVELCRRFLSVAGDGECELRQLYEMPASDAAQPA